MPVSFNHTALTPNFGAKFSSVNLTYLSDDDLTSLLTDGLAQHKLLAFQNQHLNHRDLIRIVSVTGQPLHGNPARFRVQGFPALNIVSNIFENGAQIGIYDGDKEEEWHCDHSFCQRIPAATLLYSVISAEFGGNTKFADTSSAFHKLSSDLLQKIEPFQALHSLMHLDSAQRKVLVEKPALDEVDTSLKAWHHLVTTSKFSGDRALLLGKSVIKDVYGGTQENFENVIDQLEAFCFQQQYVYEHSWRDNDLVIFDNLALMHTASPCDSKTNKRLLYRSLAV